ncbi:MAG: PEP-CTERM sorting domain-containing protein [Alphaproteobacteria bacterium]|nr:PEP-CTERM sorting domain-containing protein [Alphaproteobacteria bacterium]
MNMVRTAVAAALLAAAPGIASAALTIVTVFSDDFDAENGGAGVLNYGGFANWTVSNGTVDLIGNGFIDLLPGHGLYVDMDGSTGDAGRITSRTFDLVPGEYQIVLSIAGNQRNADTDTIAVAATLGGIGASGENTYSMPGDGGFSLFGYGLTVPAGPSQPMSFYIEGVGGDDVGLLLDSVSLERLVFDTPPSTVPAPASAGLLAAALGGFSLRRLSRSSRPQ